jgi:hypothetical protein
MNHLNTAYNHLSQIAVMGDDVDRMAMAKQELRIVFQKIGEMQKQEVKTDGQND